MGSYEVRQSINRVSNEKRALESSRVVYQNMNAKINDAINKLTKARDYLSKSYTQLEKYYQSNAANKKVTELENEYTNINRIIQELKSEILVASNNKINSINSSINHKQNELSRLHQDLAVWLWLEANGYEE